MKSLTHAKQVDWEKVAAATGLKNGNTAYTRFGQIKKRLGWNQEGGSGNAGTGTTTAPTTPKKTGSGTNKTPSRVTKTTTPKKTPGSGRGRKVKEELEVIKDEPMAEERLEDPFDDAQVEQDHKAPGEVVVVNGEGGETSQNGHADLYNGSD